MTTTPADPPSAPRPPAPASAAPGPTRSSALRVGLAWSLVSLPLAWGIFETLKKAILLFR